MPRLRARDHEHYRVLRAPPSCCEGRSSLRRVRRIRLAIITEASRHGSAATERDAKVTGRRRKRAPPHSRRRPRRPLLAHPPPTRPSPTSPYGCSARYGIPLDVVPASNVEDFFVTTPGAASDQRPSAKTRGKDPEPGGHLSLHRLLHFPPAAARIGSVCLRCAVPGPVGITSHIRRGRMGLRGLCTGQGAWTRLSKSAVATDLLCNRSPQRRQSLTRTQTQTHTHTHTPLRGGQHNSVTVRLNLCIRAQIVYKINDWD